jgi:DNA-binding response OmpR family regulator
MTRNTITALLLEDEPLIAMSIEDELENAGFVVSTVMSARDAELWLDANRPDVVIVDIMLRDGTSAGVVTRLIALQIPFLVHSGDHPSTHKGTPFTHGVWINKPATTQDILAAAQALVLA